MYICIYQATPLTRAWLSDLLSWFYEHTYAHDQQAYRHMHTIMHVYIYIYMYLYIYIYTYIDIHIHVYIYIYTYINRPSAHSWPAGPTWTMPRTPSASAVGRHLSLYLLISLSIYLSVYLYIYIHIYTYIHLSIDLYAHTRTLFKKYLNLRPPPWALLDPVTQFVTALKYL